MDTPQLYLIAHKVRGQQALDIAIQMTMGDELWWIIPTSGHRAYPYWHYRLGDLFAHQLVGPPPADWPDHYPTAVLPAKRAAVDPSAASHTHVPSLEDI